jgi:hypothetical protein
MSYSKKSSQEVNKVYKTNDLSIFKQIIGNRPPNPQHIRRLCQSIKDNGILQNPIIVNEEMDVIDGQHRLMAAIECSAPIYYIIVKGYDLNEVQILNLNQKNWTSKDFMHGYAEMGIESYLKLKDFYKTNKVFSLTDCIRLCSNTVGYSSSQMSKKFRKNKASTTKMSEVFNEGTWKGKDFDLAQENADKLKMIKPYYDGYNKSIFIASILSLLTKEDFDFFEFLQKLKYQTQKMQDCTSQSQYTLLIEEIYNYKRRDKVNLRF